MYTPSHVYSQNLLNIFDIILHNIVHEKKLNLKLYIPFTSTGTPAPCS